MKKEELVKLGLEEDMAQKVADASSEELKGYIPKSRFDEVNEAKKTLENDINTRDTQLEELKKSAGDVEGLKNKISELQTANDTAKTEYENKIKQMKIDSAVDMALINAKARNVKAAKALLDLENAELDGDKVKGLDEQIKALVEGAESKFLFASTKIVGGQPPEDVDDSYDGLDEDTGIY